jgi:hypothetical protein
LLLVAPFVGRIRKKGLLWILGLVGGLFGALPDLIGGYGNLVDHDHYRLYVSAHRGSIEQVLQYVPMYGLHLVIDTLTHGPGRRWWVWNEGLWLELLLWLVNILIFWWLVQIWRKSVNNQPGS